MNDGNKSSALDRLCKVIPTGPTYRIEIDTAESCFAITVRGIRAIDALLRKAMNAYAMPDARRERVRLEAPHTTTYGGRVDIPHSANAETIANLIAEDVRTVLARPGVLVRVEVAA